MSQFSYYKLFASQMEIRIEHLIHFFIALTSTTHDVVTFLCQIYEFLWNINHKCNILVTIQTVAIKNWRIFLKIFLFVANIREKFNVSSKCCCILISKSIQFIEKWSKDGANVQCEFSLRIFNFRELSTNWYQYWTHLLAINESSNLRIHTMIFYFFTFFRM